jgi:hypothetical protein
MTRRALRTRVLEVPRHLACGCYGQPGDTVTQDGRGRPWLCVQHSRAKVRDFEPRRGAATVQEILAAEAHRPDRAEALDAERRAGHERAV